MIVDTNQRPDTRGRNICARSRARGWALAACVLLGSALPLLVVAGAATVLRAETVGGPTRPDTPPRQRVAVRSLATAVASAAPDHALRPTAASPGRLHPVAESAQPTADTATAVPQQQAQPGPTATVEQRGADAAQPVDDTSRFFLYREVDTAAEPVADWNLDAGDLDALATSRLVFTLFVASDGRVLYCSVDLPERLTPATRHRLAERLSETAMRPARRAGVAVPSRRRVELYTDSGA